MGCQQTRASAPTATNTCVEVASADAPNAPCETSFEDRLSPTPQLSGSGDTSTLNASREGALQDIHSNCISLLTEEVADSTCDSTGQTSHTTLPETDPVAGISLANDWKPSRSKSRVSFLEAEPDVIVNSAALELRIFEMQPVFNVGDRVQVRDKGDHHWKVGVVTHLSPLQVRPDGKKTSFEWTHVLHYIETNEKEDSDEDVALRSNPLDQEAAIRAAEHLREAVLRSTLAVEPQPKKQRVATCC